MKFLSKKIELIVVVFFFILLGGYIIYFRSSIKKNKKNVDAIIYEVIESRRGVFLRYYFCFNSRKFYGKVSDFGTKYFIGDTCIIAIDSTNPEYNYFIELKNKKPTGSGLP